MIVCRRLKNRFFFFPFRERIEEPFKDKHPHLYQLILRPDNTYTIRVDHKVVNEGNVLAGHAEQFCWNF